ncbi:hypothetical protein PHMEG_0005351 [Phytophthora megakarya]|uniref:RxLR effector protein n=1 Tax=Phytophthora megakarya TaxID=4795 RepID=A0A225WRI6_9STRA|nr:hypothetical protein PHMEG_0005351 [Phytophthora megakarya]
MRVAFVLLAVIAISIVNAATNTASTTLSATTSMGPVNSIDTALDDTNSKQFLRSGRKLNGEDTNNDEERSLWDKVRKIFGSSAKNKIVPVSAEQLKTASQKVKVPQVLTKLSPQQLTDLSQGKTRQIFANWAQNKVLPKKVWPMLNGLSKNDREQVMRWYVVDIYRGGKWNWWVHALDDPDLDTLTHVLCYGSND